MGRPGSLHYKLMDSAAPVPVLTELSEHVMTCLKLGLNRTHVTGSLWVIVMSACLVGLQRKQSQLA